MATILVVEYKKHARRMLHDVLIAAGYQVILVESVSAALEVLKGNPVDLMVTGLDIVGTAEHRFAGIELVRKVREDKERRTLPIILYTAHEAYVRQAPEGSELRAVLFGINAFLSEGTDTPKRVAHEVADLLHLPPPAFQPLARAQP